MCGILGLFSNNKYENIQNKILQMSKLLRHRGPDWNGLYISEDSNIALAHERLSIVDIKTGELKDEPAQEN